MYAEAPVKADCCPDHRTICLLTHITTGKLVLLFAVRLFSILRTPKAAGDVHPAFEFMLNVPVTAARMRIKEIVRSSYRAYGQRRNTSCHAR
jgi:hypothetical protein